MNGRDRDDGDSMRKWILTERRAGSLLLLGMLLLLSACGRRQESQEAFTMRAENAEEMNTEEPVLALVLTSRDAEENERLIERFQEEAEKAGARLLVRFPDVSRAEAEEAEKETGNFVICDVNPIEYQMLIINELTAENVDVIAIRPNHSQALEPVLAGARAVGIRICAFGLEPGKECFDVYASTEEAPETAAGLLSENADLPDTKAGLKP